LNGFGVIIWGNNKIMYILYKIETELNEPTYAKSLNTIKFYMKDQEIYLEKRRNILD
jgi:hypothetical protein